MVKLPLLAKMRCFHARAALLFILLVTGMPVIAKQATRASIAGEYFADYGYMRVRPLKDGRFSLHIETQWGAEPNSVHIGAAEWTGPIASNQVTFKPEGASGACFVTVKFRSNQAMVMEQADCGLGADVNLTNVYNRGHRAARKIESTTTKVGFLDASGRFAIPALFDQAREFHEGRAAVKLKGKFGFIDLQGRLVIANRYDNVTDFSDGMAGVSAKNIFGFIDKSGKTVLKAATEPTRSFCEGLAAMKSHDGGYDYIDRNGQIAIPGSFEYAGDFHEGRATIKKNHLFGVIDKQGREIVAPGTYFNFGDFHDGLALFVKDNTVGANQGYLDLDGKVCVQPKFDSAFDFSDGLAAVKQVDLWGYIDKQGKITLPIQFSEASSFANGVAIVLRPNSVNYVVIDRSGRKVGRFPDEFVGLKTDYSSVYAIGQLLTWQHGLVLVPFDKSGNPLPPFLGPKAPKIDTTIPFAEGLFVGSPN